MSTNAEGGQSESSRVLFLSTSGGPLRFFLRPGPVKSQLHPIITAGGGVMCRTQEPAAILLADPEDLDKIPTTAVHFYVSTQYVRDCVEKQEQLDIEDYRFSVDQVQQEKSKREGGVRMGYTSEDDAAIVSFVEGRANEVRGNRVWQEMERQGVTAHSWQSMKDRYRKHLAQQLEDSRWTEELVVRRHSRKAGSVRSSPTRDPTHPSPEKVCPELIPKKNNSEAPEEPHSPPPCEGSCFKPESESTPYRCATAKRHPHSSPERAAPQSASAKKHRGNPQEEGSARKSPRVTLAEENGAKEPDGSPGSKRSLLVVQEDDVKVLRTSSTRKNLGILEAAIMEFEESDQETSDNGESTEVQPEIRPASPGAQCSSAVKNIDRAQKNGIASASSSDMCPFERESEEDELNGSVPFSRDQLEEAKQDLRNLMNESKQDLVTVTKALLKNSGDMHSSLQYLLACEGTGSCRPFWNRRDDELLLSTDPLKHKLHEKYGNEAVEKRMSFFETE
ncbi:telomeric repeat-binding factor 2-interacting protein 1 [Scleropages formosus]|uniref:Telomeric repeat-binding factor 2-interacting protein 1 n=1 Tax=Scleropages formosus TaxID=113540 RepID=A0A8C9TGG0_SCLFO|nr:telomeric repeat-binding factor 2-interacting protein 1 [Scleropages formosus]XP_018581003.1 telomeric repeat-binding factor 2-interacting protein 1 [Scleropages formosus]XP_018581005.1 telomeric repeat-binding factor 2-interacting protein 1 [Scleropages formosus]